MTKSILAATAMLAAGVAQAQWNPLVPYAGVPVPYPYYAGGVPPGQLLPEGHPPGERPWAYPHYFVWHDGGGWHLRVTSSGQYQTFAGWVDSPNGLGSVNPVIAGTPLTVNNRQIQFNLGVQGGENGFDWQQQDPCASFDLLTNGVQVPGLIDIGAYSQHPYTITPFQMCAAGAPPPPTPEAEPPPEEVSTPVGPEIDPDAFQSVLAPYGNWENVDPYGTVWRPNPEAVGPDFVPYSSGGHFTLTDAGWTWVSDYPWGWATFHYGNWAWANGWVWVPGRVWAPAWVNWRFGGGYAGWGPLGPGGVEIFYPGYHYEYVDNAHFGDAHFREYRVRPERIEIVEREARPMGATRYVNGRPVMPANAGPPRAEIEKASGHPIRPMPMAEVAKSHPVMPPAGAKGVHYANGASASHPFTTQKVQATSHPPAAAAGGGRPMNRNERPSEPARAGGGAEAGRPAAAAQRPEAAHPSGAPASAQQRAPARAAAPAAKPRPTPAPAAPPKKKK